MMVEIVDPIICQAMANDFRSTFSGKDQSLCVDGDNAKIYFLNGLISKD